MTLDKPWIPLMLILWFSSCQKTTSSVEEMPPVFRFGFQISSETSNEKVVKLQAFARYLEKKLDLPVELIELLGYAPAIEALKTNKIEMTNLGSFGYVIAEEKAGVEPLVFRGHKDTGQGMYSSYMVTANPQIKTIEDVKRMASQLKFSFGNPASTSGHLIPKKYMAQMGLYQEDFKEVLHSPDHLASLMAVITGNVDIAVIQGSTVEKFIDTKRIAATDINILYKSGPIQLGPYVIRPNLPSSFKEKVKEALLAICTEAPEIWAGIRSTSNEDIILLPARKELWDEIREMAQQTKREMFY